MIHLDKSYRTFAIELLGPTFSRGPPFFEPQCDMYSDFDRGMFTAFSRLHKVSICIALYNIARGIVVQGTFKFAMEPA